MIDNRPLFPGIRAREIFVLGLGRLCFFWHQGLHQVDGVRYNVHVIYLNTRHISSSIDLIIYYLVAINRRSAKV